jgi:putative redox protein
VSRPRSAVLVHEGGTRFVATTGTNRTIVYGDTADTNELSPVETLLACLAGCAGMDVASIALKKRQVIDRYEIRAEATQRDAYPQVLTRVDVTHVVEGSVVDEVAIRRCIELSATKYCPVNAMLSAGDTEIHHRYVIRNTGPERYEAEGEVVVTGPFRRPDPVP